MNGLISLMPDFLHEEILKIWKELNVLFGLNRVQSTLYPHVTWIISKSCDEYEIIKWLENERKKHFSFNIKTNGIGIFTGKRPAIYIQIKQNEQLIKFQKHLYNKYNPEAEDIKKLYLPENWIPHISLAIEDVNGNNISSVIKHLLPITFKHEIKITGISLVRRKKGKNMELVKNFFFPNENDLDAYK